ncbi:MAG: radical SAM protein [Patescibacteria group bacterium]|jgi:radical SAM superfamily enzyme YgiQ (UPF0313 family)
MKARVLLICPSTAIKIFKESKISVAIPHIPYLSLAALAAALLDDGYPTQILDLSISQEPLKDLDLSLKRFQPNFVGITFTTGLLKDASDLVNRIKSFDNSIKVIAGGVHSSIFPAEVVEKHNFDFAVFGEGEITLLELVSGKALETIDGLAYRDNQNKVVVNKRRELIEDLDSLPYPAFYLYNSKNYHCPRITSKKSPVVAIETSRGCWGNCIFCNKHVFQRRVRAKSAKRVVDEMEMVLNLGYKEIHIWDDCFSAALDHPKKICDEILRRELKVCWNIYNGIRVDRVDEELLIKLKAAGCYQVSFGIESGDQQVLNRSRKGITLEQTRNAVKLAKKVGIDVLGFFMIGLPGETPESIQRTIEFAKELDVDLPKVGIATPLPGTEFFDEWNQRGLILSYDWSDYTFHTTKRIAKYPELPEEIFGYYNTFYRKLYLRPSFMWKRFWRGLKTGQIFFDVYYFMKIFLRFKW